jgi:hypothetical protein
LVPASTNSASVIRRDTRFDGFLFAEIGEDKNGMCVTVLTALARLNFDPWKKAAELSRLKGDSAREILGALIANSPDLLSPNLESGLIDRLVDLLPARTFAPALNQTFGFGILTNARAFIVYVMLMAVIIAAYHLWENIATRGEPAIRHVQDNVTIN